MTLSPQFLDELRSRTLLSGLIARSVKLTRAGREWKACCPFHNEKSPSFYVNDEKGFYHCFGCSQHGDAISWMTEKQGLPFMDAVKELAEAAGIDVPAGDPRHAERAKAAETLYDVMTAAADWFAEQLGGADGAGARAYLDGRGFEAETRRAFRFGFAPDSRGRLKAALARFGNARLVEAGLLIQPDDAGREPYDRFRGRLMIPIRDRRGRVIAFGGRIIGDGEPKYLNSPETPLFDKGRTLFNLDRAASASRTTGQLVLVEGYLDVIALDQAGISEAIAPLGTAVTEAQLEAMWRLSPSPRLCFDGDSAGKKAAYRTALRALPFATPSRTLSFVNLPDGKDPDDVIRAGGLAALQRAFSKAESLSDFLWRYEIEATDDLSSPEGRAGLKERLQELAQSVGNASLSQEYRKAFSDRFWETFGWRKREVAEAARTIVASTAEREAAFRRTLMRAVLLGFSRFPEVLRTNLEAACELRLNDPHLESWRNLLVSAVEERPLLDADLVSAILESSTVKPIEKRSITKDLAFSFFKRSSHPERSQSDLARVVNTIVVEQAMDDAVERANERLMSAVEDAPWQHQLRLRADRDQMKERLRSFVESEGQAGFGT